MSFRTGRRDQAAIKCVIKEAIKDLIKEAIKDVVKDVIKERERTVMDRIATTTHAAVGGNPDAGLGWPACLQSSPFNARQVQASTAPAGWWI